MVETTRLPDERGARGSVEKELMTALRFGGLDKQNIGELVQIVTVLNREGVRALRVFPMGIPVPDGIDIQTNLTLKGLQGLVNILPKIQRISRVDVFPLGIPAIDQFTTRISIR